MWRIFSYLIRGRRTCLQGYSLIEIAIVLIIVGIMAGYGMPMLTGMQQNAKNQVTHKHQDHIIHALAGYALINGKLPLPLDTFSSKGGILIGFVPHLELGISEDLTKDGFGNHMVYVVAKSMTRTNKAPENNSEMMDVGLSDTEQNESEEERINRLLGDGDEENIFQNPTQASRPENTIRSNIVDRFENVLCKVSSPIILKNTDRDNKDVYNQANPVPFLLIGFAKRGIGPIRGKGINMSDCSDFERENLSPSSVFYVGSIKPKGDNVFRQIIAHTSRNHFLKFYANKQCEYN